MNIVTLANLGAETWDLFCLESDDAWFLHTTAWLDYTLNLNPALFDGASEAFAITENSQVLAVCPMISESRPGHTDCKRQMAYGGESCPLPALRNDLTIEKRKGVFDFVFSHLDQLALRQGIARISLRHNTLAKSYWAVGCIPFNTPLRYGYTENNLFAQIIDLRQAEEHLLQGMRKGHHYDVRRSQEILTYDIFDATNINSGIFGLYQELHAKAAGRRTRPTRTFELMESWVRTGFAVLCGARMEEKYVGFALVFTYKAGSFYASACNDPDCCDLPVGHGVQWAIMRYLKQRGMERYDLGLLFWDKLFHYVPSPKEMAIARFKRGFGGTSVPVLSAEKYYDRKVFADDFGNRLSRYLAAWGS